MNRNSLDKRDLYARIAPALLIGLPMALVLVSMTVDWRDPAVWIASAAALIAVGVGWSLIAVLKRKLIAESAGRKDMEAI